MSAFPYRSVLVTGMAGLLSVGALAISSPAPASAMTPAGDGWANQIGATLLGPIIHAAGGDKADQSDPDSTDTTSGKVLTGAGVGVALIDSGVSPVAGLSEVGKIIYGPDLSFDSQSPNLRNLDSYGHGTHMAGIIAGHDPASVTTGRFDGSAPGAHIVSVKVASADGAADVSQVIAGIEWVVEHRNDKGMNIRVLNLSYGTDSVQAADVDPLSFAVEQAWAHGIVVVVAAGNNGLSSTSLTTPATNPDVIAVGAADSMGTDTRSDDTVADFTNRGNAARHPDVLAPGRSIVSLRDPGSYIDVSYPAARLSTTDDPAQRFFRGSGTSQATAMVSGSVALLLQQRPNLTPDQVKSLLMSTADPLKKTTDIAAGSGEINVAQAARAKTPLTFRQLNKPSNGLGSLETSRGSAHVYDSSTGAVLTGEKDIFGNTWSPLPWTLASRVVNTWNGGAYNGTTWTGSVLGATQSGDQAWNGVTWTGRSWAGTTWTGRSWASAVWTGRSWAGTTWSGRTWSGRSWAAAGWTGAPWR